MLKSLKSQNKFFLWALLGKSILFVVFAVYMCGGESSSCIHNVFTYSKDFDSYITPSVNLVEKGEYFESSLSGKLYAHKMPGMAVVFAPLYYLFGFENGLVILVVIQLLAEALSVVMLAKIFESLNKSRSGFYVVFIFYALSCYVSVYTHYATSESLCTSLLVAGFYFLLVSNHRFKWWLAGFFLCWSVFFRPLSALSFPFAFYFLICISKNEGRPGKIFSRTMALLAFFVFAETAWIARNYAWSNRFVPLELSYENFGNPPMRSLIRFVQAIGGDCQSWNPDSEMRWFGKPGTDYYDRGFSASNPFPAYLKDAGVTLEKLTELRNLYWSYNDTIHTTEAKLLESGIVNKADSFTQRVRSQLPLQYYIVSPLKLTAKLVFIKRPYGFTSDTNNFYTFIVRYYYFGLYYITVLLFIFSFFIKKNKEMLVMLVYVLTHIFVYSMLLRLTENRYLITIWPFFVLIASRTILTWWDKWQVKFGHAGLKRTEVAEG